jgi:hypothetical protein
MSDYVTVSIPEPLYRRARALARARQRPLDAVIAEVFEQGLPPEPADVATPAEVAMAREIAAYEAMHPTLMTAHANEYVAIFGGELVDHDPDQTALLRRIDARFPDDVVLLKRVRPLPEPELRIRSPRLVR